MGKQFVAKEARNQEIVRRHDAGESQTALARELGISRSAVSAIYLREKAKVEWAQGPFASLPTRCYPIIEKAMKRHMGLSSFTINDLREFIEQNLDWEKKLNDVFTCGPQRMKEIRQFLWEQGLIPQGA